jgi:hypothetical protein
MPVDHGLQVVEVPDAYESLTFRHGAATFRNGLSLTVHLRIGCLTENHGFLVSLHIPAGMKPAHPGCRPDISQS